MSPISLYRVSVGITVISWQPAGAIHEAVPFTSLLSLLKTVLLWDDENRCPLIYLNEVLNGQRNRAEDFLAVQVGTRDWSGTEIPCENIVASFRQVSSHTLESTQSIESQTQISRWCYIRRISRPTMTHPLPVPIRLGMLMYGLEIHSVIGRGRLIEKLLKNFDWVFNWVKLTQASYADNSKFLAKKIPAED